MTVRHICSWQYQFTLKKRGWALKNLHSVFTFIVAKLSTGQETALTLSADSMLSKLDNQDKREDDFQIC